MDAPICPHCGALYPTLAPEAARRRRWRRWLLVIVGVVVVLIVLIVLASHLDLFDWSGE